MSGISCKTDDVEGLVKLLRAFARLLECCDKIEKDVGSVNDRTPYDPVYCSIFDIADDLRDNLPSDEMRRRLKELT